MRSYRGDVSKHWRRVLAAALTGLLLTMSSAAVAADIHDPAGDVANSSADMYGVQVVLTPTDLRLTVYLMSSYSLAATYGGSGLTARITIQGSRFDGSVDTQVLDIDSEGSVNEGNGDFCPGDAPQNTSLSPLNLDLDNTTQGCFGHFVSVAVAVQTIVVAGDQQYLDRAPDTGYGDVVSARTESQWVAVTTGGHTWSMFAYQDNPYLTKLTCSQCITGATFGQPGDTVVTADSDEVPPCQVNPAQSCLSLPYVAYLMAVRPSSTGGLRWYQQFSTGDPLPGMPAGLGYTPPAASVRTFAFGNNGDIPVTGDWDGDGVVTIGLFRPSTGQWFLTDDPAFVNAPGAPLTVLKFGSPGDQPISGDWNGQGRTMPGVFRNGRWYELTSLHSGGADISFTYGQSGDIAVPGDWNGDGVQTPGIYRAGRWYQTNNRDGGASQNTFLLGDGSLKPLVPILWYTNR